MSTFTNIFKDIGHGIAVAAVDVKNAILKAANATPGILNTVEQDAPEIEALVGVVVPGAKALVPAAVTLAESIASVISQGGAAAEQDLLNAGVDQEALNGVKSLVPAFQQFAVAAKKA